MNISLPKTNLSAQLLIILNEESSEVLKDILFDNCFMQESYELLAVFSMLETIIKPLSPEPFYSGSTLKRFNLDILNLQYFISKSLRFGILDSAPGSDKTNLEEIQLVMDRISFFIFERFGRETYLEVSSAKIEKVDKFLIYSRENGSLSD